MTAPRKPARLPVKADSDAWTFRDIRKSPEDPPMFEIVASIGGIAMRTRGGRSVEETRAIIARIQAAPAKQLRRRAYYTEGL